MPEQPIRIKSVNVHRNNGHTHDMLQTDDEFFDIILIQKPWFGSVATLRSDTDPNGTAQQDFTANNKWHTLSPPYTSNDRPKVCAYINRRTIDHTLAVNHIPLAPLISPNSMVIDILCPTNRNDIALRLVNIYHDRPLSGHSLSHLFSHTLDDDIPTLFLGDFNTHSPRWSLPHSTASSWACSFHEWMDSNGLETLNPTNEVTWKQRGSRLSIIDLGLANESARYLSNLSALTISWKESISDHAALLINFYTEEDTQPLPAEYRGFHIDAARKEDWTATFRSLVTEKAILESTSPTEASDKLHDAILTACQCHLDKIKSGPPKGVVWWNEDCTNQSRLLKSSRPGIERRQAAAKL